MGGHSKQARLAAGPTTKPAPTATSSPTYVEISPAPMPTATTTETVAAISQPTKRSGTLSAFAEMAVSTCARRRLALGPKDPKTTLPAAIRSASCELQT